MATASTTSEDCMPAAFGPPLCQQVPGFNTAKIVGGMVTIFVGVPIGVLMGLAPDVPHVESHGGGNPSPSPGKAPGVVVTGGF
jgi:hypothetical protein